MARERAPTPWTPSTPSTSDVPPVPCVTLRPMVEEDLGRVGAWLREPHVARWWTTPVEVEIATYRAVLEQPQPRTVLLVVEADAVPVGWCQWYRWDDDPSEAAAVDAHPGEVGIDYAVGEPGHVGRGVGTSLVGALVGEVRREAGDVGIVCVPAAANAASRRVLEKNAFVLVDVRRVVTEPTEEPMAIYRLPSPGS